MPKFIDITGNKYARLTVVSCAPNVGNNITAWNCVCECGTETVVRGFYLKSGRTKSCGCYQRELSRNRMLKHGKSGKKDKVYTREIHIKRKYGLSLQCYNEMFEAQNGCCSICNYKFGQKSGDCYVDHCHTTKVVRGLLCQNCNSAIGHARDNIDFLCNAAHYLSKYQYSLAR